MCGIDKEETDKNIDKIIYFVNFITIYNDIFLIYI